jgi:hypothetical protein
MTVIGTLTTCGSIALCAVTAVAAGALGQEPRGLAGVGIFANEPVIDAPFSADVTTTIVDPDRNPRTRSFSSRYYRHSTGRARVDYEVPGPTARATDIITLLLTDPVRKTLYSAEQETGIVRRSPFDIAVRLFDPSQIAWIPLGRVVVFGYPGTTLQTGPAAAEPLGTRTREGIAIEGYRVADGTGMSQEWWLAPDLQILVDARVVRPNGFDARRRLFNIQRAEQASELFELPLEEESRFTFCVPNVVTDFCPK